MGVLDGWVAGLVKEGRGWEDRGGGRGKGDRGKGDGGKGGWMDGLRGEERGEG